MPVTIYETLYNIILCSMCICCKADHAVYRWLIGTKPPFHAAIICQNCTFCSTDPESACPIGDISAMLPEYSFIWNNEWLAPKRRKPVSASSVVCLHNYRGTNSLCFIFMGEILRDLQLLILIFIKVNCIVRNCERLNRNPYPYI